MPSEVVIWLYLKQGYRINYTFARRMSWIILRIIYLAVGFVLGSNVEYKRTS